MKSLRLLGCLAVLLFTTALLAAVDPPTISMSSPVFPEGDGASEGFITFTLSHPYDAMIGTSFRLFRPANPDAYWANVRFGDPCRIPAGETSCQTRVIITGNDSYQSIHKVWNASVEYMVLEGPNTGAFPGQSSESFFIELTEDDPIPTVTLADASINEPESGVIFLAMTFETSAPVTGSLKWRVIDETAGNLGYFPGLGTFPEMMKIPLQFHQTPMTIGFGIQADNLDEPNETFLVELYDPFDLTLERTQVRVTIIDADIAFPTITASDITIQEGDDGSTNAVVTLQADGPVNGSFTWFTANGSASHEEHDFEAGEGVVTMNGTTTAQLSIPVYGDTMDEPDEWFRIALRQPEHVVLGTQDIAITILDDDEPAPELKFTPPTLTLYSGQSANVQAAFVTPQIAMSVPLHRIGNTITVPPSVFVPAGGIGSLTVNAVQPGGASVFCISESAQCQPLTVEVLAQHVDSFSPAMVRTSGHVEVTITGLGFSEGCTVMFDDKAALSVAVDGLNTIRATAPPHPPGVVPVTVTCGATTVSAADSLEYVVPRRRAVR